MIKSYFKIILLLIMVLIVTLFQSNCNSIKIDNLIHKGIPDNNLQETSVPFVLKGGSIIVQTHINNSVKKYNMLLSTSFMTSVSKDLAKEFSLEKINETEQFDPTGVVSPTPITILNSIRVGDAKLTNCASYIQDIKELISTEIDGVLGCNFLRFYKVTIDYHKKVISFSRNKEMVVNKDDIVVKFSLDSRFGFATKIACKIENIESDFIVSTGSPNSICIPASIMRQLKKTDTKDIIKSKLNTPFGASDFNDENNLLRIDNFQIRNTEFYKLPVTSYSNKKYLSLGLIGNGFLSNFTVIFNFRDKILVLKPNANKLDSNFYLYGFSLIRKNNKIVVSEVWENSPADKAGIKSGDEILFVNSQNANKLSNYELYDLVSDKSTSIIELVFFNNGGNKTIKLEKENLLPDVK